MKPARLLHIALPDKDAPEYTVATLYQGNDVVEHLGAYDAWRIGLDLINKVPLKPKD